MNKQIQQLREDVTRKIEARKAAEAAEKTAIACLQGWCKHPVESIVEVPHYSGLIQDRPPIRLCRDCGLTEDGWYFKALDIGVSKVPQIDFETCMRERLCH